MNRFRRTYAAGLVVLFCGLAIFVSSCGNCRWVEDCRYKDGGYWDCPSDPVAPSTALPKLKIYIESKTQSDISQHQASYTITIKNEGDGTAKNVQYRLQIRSPYLHGGTSNETKVDETVRNITIPASQSHVIKRSVSDNVFVTGGNIYTLWLNVSYYDANGDVYGLVEYWDR